MQESMEQSSGECACALAPKTDEQPDFDVPTNDDLCDEGVLINFKKLGLSEKYKLAYEMGKSERPSLKHHASVSSNKDLNALLSLDVTEGPENSCKIIHAFLSGIADLHLGETKEQTNMSYRLYINVSNH